MRNALRDLPPPGHIGLAYDAWAPTVHGKVPDDRRDKWLDDLANRPISGDYKTAFARWKSSFQPPDRLAKLTLGSRLLIGHGNASATDVGLTVHHTWGVPIIPGSALKGLVAHYLDAVYSPDDPSIAPWDSPQIDRAPFQGVTWDERRRPLRGPGDAYRLLFGAPDASEDLVAREHGYSAGATGGLVTFHDALYIPVNSNSSPFAPDVLTVHQKTYYDRTGTTWPNDHDDPNPVAFLTIKPGTQLQLALSGPPAWTQQAADLLSAALSRWGIGGKTSAGYGIGAVDEWKTVSPPPAPPSPIVEEFRTWLDGQNELGIGKKQILGKIDGDWFKLLVGLAPGDKDVIATAIRRSIKKPKPDELLKRLMASEIRLTDPTEGSPE